MQVLRFRLSHNQLIQDGSIAVTADADDVSSKQQYLNQNSAKARLQGQQKLMEMLLILIEISLPC